MRTKVVLIGGPPGAGKTTLGRAVAAHLDWPSLTIDHLSTAASAVTTPESHPGLHIMSSAQGYADYYTNRSGQQLIDDANAQHEATWPAVERVIRNHASWGTPIVIDGWALRPQWVDRLGLNTVLPVWIVTTKAVLEEREANNTEFYAQSDAPEQMMDRFLERSLWHNRLIESEAIECQMKILRQDGTASVEALRDAVLNAM